MKNIINSLFLIFGLICFSTSVVAQHYYVDDLCANPAGNDCLDNKVNDISSWLNSLHQDLGLTVNLLVFNEHYSLSFSEQTNNQGAVAQDLIQGPAHNNIDNCIWFDSDVDFLLVIRPDVLHIYQGCTEADEKNYAHVTAISLHDGAVNSGTGGLSNITCDLLNFDNVAENFSTPYSQGKLYINRAQKILLALEEALTFIKDYYSLIGPYVLDDVGSVKYPFLNDEIPTPEYSNAGLMLLSPLNNVYNGEASFFDYAQIVKELNGLTYDFCNPVRIRSGYNVIANYGKGYEFPVPALSSSSGYLDLSYVYSKETNEGYEINKISKLEIAKVLPSNSIYFNNQLQCYQQIQSFEETDFTNIEEYILEKDKDENSVLAIKDGLQEIKGYLDTYEKQKTLSGLEPSAIGSECSIESLDTDFAFCVPRNESDLLEFTAFEASQLEMAIINPDSSGFDHVGYQYKMWEAAKHAQTVFNYNMEFIVTSSHYSITVGPQPTGPGAHSMDEGVGYFVNNDLGEALEHFNNSDMGEEKDMIVWQHYDYVNDRVCFKFRYRDNYFDFTAGENIDQSLFTQEFKDDLKESMEYSFYRVGLNHRQAFEQCDLPDESILDGGEGNNQAWAYGIRDGKLEQANFWNIIGEIGGHGKSLLKKGNLEKAGWESNGATIMVLPAYGVGIVDGILEEALGPLNLVTQLPDLLKAGWSFIDGMVESEEKRSKVWETLTSPMKMFNKLYESMSSNWVKDASCDCFTNEKHHGQAKIITSSAIQLFNAVSLIKNLFKKLKNKGNDALGKGDLSESAYNNFKDKYKNILPDEATRKKYDKFILGVDDINVANKIKRNPELIQVWKAMDGATPQLDVKKFSDAIKKFPESSNTPFFEKFKKEFNLVDGSGNMPSGGIPTADVNKLEKFFDDVNTSTPGPNGTSVGDDLIAHLGANPGGVKAWKFAFDYPNLRVNTDVLQRLSTKFGNVLGDIKNVTDDFVGSSTSHLDLGGHNRYPDAVKLSFENVDYGGNSIKNLIEGDMNVNLPKIPSGKMDRITIENAPYTDQILSEVNRVTKSGGTVELEHFTGTISDYNVIANKVNGDIVSTETFIKNLEGSDFEFTRVVIEKL